MTDSPILETVPLGAIKPYPQNPRSRPKGQIKAIAASIKEKNGFNTPIVIDEDNVIINGHGRYEAAQLLALTKVPVIRVAHLSDAQKRAYRIADNKMASLSSWDMELLPLKLQAVIDGGIDCDLTGFTAAEVDITLDAAREAAGPDLELVDETPPLRSTAITKPGQIWALGKHRLLCGDARDRDAVLRLMEGERAHMVFSDPPYNVKIDGFAVGGGVKHQEFAMASGEMSSADFKSFLTLTVGNMAHACHDGAILFVCMDWRHMTELLHAGASTDLRLLNLIVWAKTNGGMGTFYRSRHELIFAFKNGEAPHINTFGLGDGGRYRTNVWEYRGANAFGPSRSADLEAHPTVKPARMIADAIKDVSHRGDLVLDTFGGSGSTLIAAEMTGRRARLVEIEPTYVDLTIRRWETLTGRQAIDAATGATFEDLQAAANPEARNEAA